MIISRFLPESRIKDKLRWLYDTRRDPRIYDKIAFLPILDSVLSEEETPFVKLSNGLTFYGYPPDKNQKCLYKFADERIKEKVKESAFGVAHINRDKWSGNRSFRRYEGNMAQNLNLVIAAQYNRFGQPSYKTVVPMLKDKGFSILIDTNKVCASKVA